MQMLCFISQLHADQHLATTVPAAALGAHTCTVPAHLPDPCRWLELLTFCTFVVFRFQYLHDLDEYEAAKKKKKQRDCEVSRVGAPRPSTFQHASWFQHRLSALVHEAGLEPRSWVWESSQVDPHAGPGRGPTGCSDQRRISPLQLQQHIYHACALCPASRLRVSDVLQSVMPQRGLTPWNGPSMCRRAVSIAANRASSIKMG